MQKRTTKIAVVAAIVTLMITGMAMAQGGRGGQRGNMRNMDPAERQKMMEERMATAMKAQLEITDAEWTALKPFILKVSQLTQETRVGGRGGMMGGRGGMMGGRGGMMGGRGGQAGQTRGGRGGQADQANGGRGGQADQTRGGRGGREDAQPQSEVAKLAAALEEELNKETPNNAQIKAKLAALRKARTTAEQKLVKAQNELRALLTPKQEARCVIMGLLK